MIRRNGVNRAVQYAHNQRIPILALTAGGGASSKAAASDATAGGMVTVTSVGTAVGMIVADAGTSDSRCAQPQRSKAKQITVIIFLISLLL